MSWFIYLVMALLLMLQMLMRLGLVDLLIVVAPLAMACWVLPQTQAWARLWSSLFTGTVFVQGLQVLGLRLGTALGSELSGTAAGAHAETLQAFLGIAVLALVLRLPRYMPGPSYGASGVGTLLQVVAIGRALGMARGARAAGARGVGGRGGRRGNS